MTNRNQPWTPDFQRIHEVLDRWADERADAVALQDMHTRLSYAELKAAVAANAAQLRAHGVRPGDRLMLVAENSVATAVLLLAGSALDAWVVVVNARLSAREIDDFIEHSGARRVVYMSHVSAQAAAHGVRHGAQAVELPALGSLLLGPLAGNARA
ncbi:MAG TPA: AMP-binding protein, partial [Burkholderiaceae bacterium]|nr:AMP-binding protein [Burkholderiaceae bacterium]